MVSESGVDEIPRASHPHVWVLTAFLSILLFLVAWRAQSFSPTASSLLFSQILETLSSCFNAFFIGGGVALLTRVSITRKVMLRDRLLESMDLDELEGGPWLAVDPLGNQIKSYRAPLRYEPPFVPQPPDFLRLNDPEVRTWINEHPESVQKACPYELQALSWCAFQGTPASVTNSHGGVSLFAHSAKVWLAAAESFGYGSDPALLSVSHDLGKVLAYACSDGIWAMTSASHEHLSVVSATRLSALLILDEPTRRRLINHLIAYSLRKKQKATDPEAIFNIRSVVRADASVSSLESSQSHQSDHGSSGSGAEVIPLPPKSATIIENEKILSDAGLLILDGAACSIIPLPVEGQDTPEQTSYTDSVMGLDISEYRVLSSRVGHAITLLNINGSKRRSGTPQGIYCSDTGFFVRVFDLVRQLKADGVAIDFSPEDATLPPWQTQAGAVILTVMARTGWIVASPGRFSSDEGDRGVFNLKSGSKRYNGMVSINPDMLPDGYSESINEWCFDVDAVR